MSDAQFAALAMGAHPYRVCQLHWHSADYRPLLEKMGIDAERAWAEFQSDLRRLGSGEKRYLDWDDADGAHDAHDPPVPAHGHQQDDRG
jgi:heterodisulfide reductase subunit B